MDSRLIHRLRRGQAEARDFRLAALLVERGLFDGSEAQDLLDGLPAGALKESLIGSGRLSIEAAARIEEELRLRESTGDPALPEEARAAASDLRVRLGKYALVRELGRGGMGEVWKAWDLRLHRWVAIKRLQGKETLERFQREADLAARLSHPGIVQIYDVGYDSRHPYLALEFVDGASLEGRTMARRQAAEAVRHAAQAVQHAHDRGVLHRDLKPSNLLRSSSGRIVVSDFGLAQAVDRDSTLTRGGAVLGTPSFMAPERGRGEPATVATDVFGLGATLYALVEGRPPFVGSTPENVIRRAIRAESTPPSVRDDLASIIGKSMEREPEDRYRSALELAEDLERFLSDRPVSARKTSQLRRICRLARRHSLATLCGGVLVLGLSAGSAYRFRTLDAVRRAEQELDRAERIRLDLHRLSAADVPESTLVERALEDLESHTRKALEWAPDHEAALYQQGISCSLRRRFSEAERFFTRVLERDASHSEARAHRGLARFYQAAVPFPTLLLDGSTSRVIPTPLDDSTLRRVTAAASDFDVLPPNHPERDYGRGLIELALGRYAVAREALSRAVARAPYLLSAREMLVRAELLEGDFEGALQNATRLLAMGNREASVWASRAYANAMKGRVENAVDDGREALTRRPDWTALRGFVGFWLTKLGRFPEAVQEYDQALRTDPGNLRCLLGRSLARLRLGDAEGAAADAREACSRAPLLAEAHLRRGLAAADDGEVVEALTRAAELDPTLSEALAWRGNRHLRSGRLEAALEDYRTAVRIEPGFPAWRMLLGLGHLALEEFEEADVSFTAFLDRRPEEAEGYLYRGKVRYLQGRWNEALSDLDRALALRPSLETPELDLLMAECRRQQQPK